MRDEAVIIGYSGHAFVVLDILYANNIVCRNYCEQNQKSLNPYELGFLGSEYDSGLLEYLRNTNSYIGVGNNTRRKEIYRHLNLNGIPTPALFHPSSIRSPMAIIGPASIVMQGGIINSLSKVGTGVICNTGCIIEHECTVGDFSHIAPGSVLAGNVSVGTNTFIGANSVIRQGITVGNRVVIGAGSVIIKDVPDDSKVYGNPGKIKQ